MICAVLPPVWFFHLRALKMEAQEGPREGQKMSYHLTLILLTEQFLH